MPFQDIEDTATPAIPRSSTPFERWLRRIFLEDWSLKLALAITIVLWLAVTGQNKPVTMRVSGVQVNFLKHEGLEISNEPPTSVEVILTGSPAKLDEIGPRGLAATVDVTDQKAGERVVRLSLDRVKMVLPEGVKIQGFQPATIPIRLEPSIEAQLDVEVKFEGKLPEAYEVVSVSANPSRIRVKGPSDRINALHTAATETVWLDGKTESFSLSRVAINIPDPKIDILDPTVDVSVEIAEKSVVRVISDLAPTTYHLTWPASALPLIVSSTSKFTTFQLVMTKLFGTDGMRGEAGKFPLDAETLQIVGASLANHLKDKLGRPPLILVGRDTRESGEWLEQALVAGAATAGADSRSAGVITTPGVAFLARTLPADAGVVISASHNPYRDNGVKIFAPSGRKLDEETERLIESDVFSAATNMGRGNQSLPNAKTIRTNDESAILGARYLDFLATQIGQGLSLNGIRLVLDCANGAASVFAPKLFGQLGATVTTINNNPDGRNINLDCGSLHTEGLKREVLAQKADLGVAFDGDADRALFVDGHGRLTNGDASLWVLANYLHARKQLAHDTVVATVMSNIGLEIAFKSQGLHLVRTDVGDKYVLDELMRLGATLGGEQSGHIIFPKLSLAGDGLITTICLLRAMTAEGKTLQELTVGFQTFPQILVNVGVRVKRPFAEVASIQTAARNIENQLGSRGRLLLRYSGTEPLARVMIEGESHDEIEQQARKLAGVIRKELGSLD